MIKYIIKDIRESKGMTLKELSQRTGISISYLFDIENNKKSVSFEKIYKISIALGEKIDNIFFATSEIESVKRVLHLYIEKYGITDERTQKISRIMDKLVIRNMKYRVSQFVEKSKKSSS